MRPSQRRRQVVVLSVTAGAALVGLALEIAGAAPWLAVTTTVALATLAGAQRFSWGLSVAASVVGLLTGYTILIRVGYLLPVALDYQVAAGLFAVSAVAWVGLLRGRADLRVPAWPSWIVLLPSAALVTAMVIAVTVTNGTRVSWAMQNDAVWNTMTARFILADHGVSPDYASAAPLTPALIAGAIAPGRSTLDPSLWMQHDATRAAELWLLLILASMVLAGVVALSALSQLRPILRGVFSLFIALVPLTWFVAGNAIQFGFYNATIAIVLLLCAWLAWLAAPAARLAALTTLAMCTVSTLATWAPLAVIPVALAIVALVRAPRIWWRSLRGMRLLVAVLAAGGVVAYTVGFTLLDLLREGGSLAANGGIFTLGPRQVALTAVIALGAMVLGGVALRRWRDAVGVGIVIVSAAVGLGILLAQRRSLDDLWGYYPAKFSWLILVLLIVVAGAALFSLVARAPRWWAAAGWAVVAAASTIVLLAFPHPMDGALTAAWPTLVPSVGGRGEVTTELFSLSDPGQKNLVSSSVDDRFINGWLLQQQAIGPNDPLRAFAYTLDADDPDQLCEVAAVWGPGIVVHSPTPGLDGDLRAACPTAGITAVTDR